MRSNSTLFTLGCAAALALVGCSKEKNLPGTTLDAGLISDGSVDAGMDARVIQDAALLMDLSGLDLSWGQPVFEAGECIGDLSTVGQGDFTLAFDVTTTATHLSQLIDQRADCSGNGAFWQIRLQPTGFVTFEISDGVSEYINATTMHAVNDGATHRVIIYRASGLIHIETDGVTGALSVIREHMLPAGGGPATITTPPNYTSEGAVNLGPSLHALEWTGGLVCTRDGTIPLVGTVVPLCVSPGNILL